MELVNIIMRSQKYKEEYKNINSKAVINMYLIYNSKQLEKLLLNIKSIKISLN